MDKIIPFPKPKTNATKDEFVEDIKQLCAITFPSLQGSAADKIKGIIGTLESQWPDIQGQKPKDRNIMWLVVVVAGVVLLCVLYPLVFYMIHKEEREIEAEQDELEREGEERLRQIAPKAFSCRWWKQLCTCRL